MMCNKIFILSDLQVCARVSSYNSIHWYLPDSLSPHEGEETTVLPETCHSKQFIELIKKVDEELIDILHVNSLTDLFIIGM